MTRTILMCLALRLIDCAPAPRTPTEADAGPPLVDADSGVIETGAVVRIHLRASEEPVPHDPATSGQTPRNWVSGIRSLHLLRSAGDPEPALVFRHDGFVEASYEGGADTVVATVPIARLTPGRFAFARAVHTHTRFTIDATMHAGYGPMAGTFTDLIVLSDDTIIDGVEYDHGDYRFVFETGGMRFPTQGSGLALPPLSSGGFDVRLEDGELAYTFPVDLVVTDALTEDVDFVFEVNVHEAFRWTDTSDTDHAEGVFDASPLGTEPVTQAGASSYRFYLE